MHILGDRDSAKIEWVDSSTSGESLATTHLLRGVQSHSKRANVNSRRGLKVRRWVNLVGKTWRGRIGGCGRWSFHNYRQATFCRRRGRTGDSVEAQTTTLGPGRAKDYFMLKTPKKKRAFNHYQLHKTPTGIKGFDEITEGGLPKNRTTLFSGSTGTGKTLLGIDFRPQTERAGW